MTEEELFEAIRETLCISKENNILKDYLSRKEKFVV